MNKTINLSIPLGFKVIEKIENMKVWQAEAHLLTKRYRRHTKAVRKDDEAYPPPLRRKQDSFSVLLYTITDLSP